MATYITRIILFLFILSTPVHAAVLVQYNITGNSLDTTANATGIAGGTITNASLTNLFTNSLGYSTDPVIQAQPASGATSISTAVSTNSYFSFSVTPTNLEMDLTSLTFNVARGGSSTPRGWVLRSSIDSYASNIASGTVPTQRTTFTGVSVDLSGASFQNLTSAVTFRIYSFSPGTSLSLEYDDITLNGTTTSVTPSFNSDTFDDSPPTLNRFIEIERSGTTCTAKIYSDNQYSNLLDTLTVTCSSEEYSLIYPAMSYNSGVSGSSFTGSVSNLDITAESGSSPASSPAVDSTVKTGTSKSGGTWP